MIPIHRLLTACTLLLLCSSCREKSETTSKKEARLAEKQFFEKNADQGLAELSNEMARGETDLLKSYQKHDFPWQHWDLSLLKKAEKFQRPIFTLILDPLSQHSYETGEFMASDPEVRELLRQNYICSVVDIQVNPELGLTAFQLSTGGREPIAFPYLLWLSHEGHSISGYPLGIKNRNDVRRTLKKANTLMQDLWSREQRYAIESSRENAALRQKKFDAQLSQTSEQNDEPKVVKNREEIITYGGRRIVSFYNPLAKDFDSVGGLLPASILQILARQANYPGTNKGTRDLAERAILGLSETLNKNAVHDAVDGGYFHSRRNDSWNLPNFNKSLKSQARLATALLEGGSLLQKNLLSSNGLAILDYLESHWQGDQLKSFITTEPPLDKPDTFFFRYDTLKTLLGRDFNTAQSFYGLAPKGNISTLDDPQRRFLDLNVLAPKKTPEAVADDTSQTVENAKDAIVRIKKLISAERKKNITLRTETNCTAEDLANLGLAQVARYRAKPTSNHLTKALSTGNDLAENYLSPDSKFLRLKGGTPARGRDYATSGLFFSQLYLATFDEKWLQLCQQITDQALSVLKREGMPLLECPASEQVASTLIHDSHMIFSESSLGIFDNLLGILVGLTNEERYRHQREIAWRAISEDIDRFPIVHTDFLKSSYFADRPLTISLSGNPDSKDYHSTLAALNHPRFSCFAIPIPGEKNGSNVLEITLSRTSATPDSPKELLGRTSDLAEFEKIFQNALSKKE